MASKLEIILTAKNETGGAIGQVKSALGGLSNVAKTTVVAAGAATVGAVAAITTAVGVGVGKAASLEQNVADIASVMGMTFDEAKPLKDLIQSLGIDPKLKVDAAGAADAIMQLAQSGISAQDIIGGAARSTVLLSNATGGDMATSAAVASDAMALFGISAQDMAKAVNGITGVTVASKFGIQDYQFALAAAGGVASAVGVNFDDFNAAITAIAPNFAGGSDAGTSFKTFLQRLVPASNAAESAMRQLGIITEDGKNRFYDANGQIKSMADISQILSEATAGLSDEQMNAALSTAFGTDAIRAAAGLAKVGAKGFNDLAGNIGKVNAEMSAATRMSTFSAKMEILFGIIDGLLTKIGDAFLPTLSELADWAGDFVSKNGDKLTVWFEGIARWLRDVTPGVADLARRGFEVLGLAVGTVLPYIEGIVNGIGQALATGDFTKLGEAVAAAFNAMMKFVSDNLATWVSVLAGWAGAALNWFIVDVAPNIIPAFISTFTSLWTWLGDNLPSFAAAFAGWAAAAIDWLTGTNGTGKKVIDGIVAAFTPLWTWITDNLPKWQAALAWWAAAVVDWISGKDGAGEKVWAGVSAAFTSLWTWLTDNLPKWTSALADWAGAAWKWFVDDAWPALWGAVTSAFNALIKFVGDNLPKWWKALSDWAVAAWQWLVDAWPKVWELTVSTFQSIIKYVQDNLPAWMTQLSLWGASAWQWIADSWPKLWEWIVFTFQSITKYLADSWPLWWVQLGTWGSAMWQWIVDAWPTMWQWVVSTFQAVVGYVQTNYPLWVEALSTWSTELWQWIVDANNPVRVELQKLWNETIKPWLDEHGNGLGTEMEGWAGDMVGFAQKVKDGWELAWPDVQLVVKNAADSIGTDIDRIMVSLGKIASWFGLGGEGDVTRNGIARFFVGMTNALAVPVVGFVHLIASILDIVLLIGDLFGALQRQDWGAAGDIARNIAGTLFDTIATPFRVPFDMYNGFQEGWNPAGSLNGNNGGGGSGGGSGGFGGGNSNTSGTTNVYNTYNINLTSTGNAGSDVLSTVQTLQALYG